MSVATFIKLIAAFICGFFSASLFFLSSSSAKRTTENHDEILSNYKHSHTSILRSMERSPDPAFNLSPSPDKKLIILVTGYRSGSSFLGSIFDSNPSIQYMFEPFHGTTMTYYYKRDMLIGARPDHSESDLRMLYLQQLLHNCTVYPTGFHERYQFCGTEAEHWFRFGNSACSEDIARRKRLPLYEICMYRKTTVIKVIRLQDLSDIFKVAKIKSANIKIIQLLRHPVALSLSRSGYHSFFEWDKRKKFERTDGDIDQRRIRSAFEAFNYCHEHLKLIELVENDPWFKERYLRITHLEMSLKPLETAKIIYSFVNETFTPQVRDHIANVTNGESENKLRNPLIVYRNTSMLIDDWKELKSFRLGFWDVSSIEMECKRLFGPLRENLSADAISRQKQLKIHSDMYNELDGVNHRTFRTEKMTYKIKPVNPIYNPLTVSVTEANTSSVSTPNSSSTVM